MKMKKGKKSKESKESELELQYPKIFSPLPLPYQGIYTEEDSLEQPSALKDVPSTTTISAEA